MGKCLITLYIPLSASGGVQEHSAYYQARQSLLGTNPTLHNSVYDDD